MSYYKSSYGDVTYRRSTSREPIGSTGVVKGLDAEYVRIMRMGGFKPGELYTCTTERVKKLMYKTANEKGTSVHFCYAAMCGNTKNVDDTWDLIAYFPTREELEVHIGAINLLAGFELVRFDGDLISRWLRNIRNRLFLL